MSNMMCHDPASYAAILRSRREYRAASIFEQHLGERRGFGPRGEALTLQTSWKIPDCRKCNDFGKDDLLMFAGEYEPDWWYTKVKETKRQETQASRWANKKILEKIEIRLLKALRVIPQ